MIREIYMLLAEELRTISEIKEVNWYLNQDKQVGDDYMRAIPAAYLKFSPIPWKSIGDDVQRAVLTFEVRLVSSTRYGDEADMTDKTHINHLANQSLIYQLLMRKRYLLSDHPEYAILQDTPEDRMIIETIDRIPNTTIHDQINNLIITSEKYQCTIFDYSAAPVWQKIQAMLDLQVEISMTL